jgi:hypothetical protein
MAGKKKKKPKQPKKKKHPPKPPPGTNVLSWEDDPQGNTPVSVPTPDPAEKPLAFRFPTPAPAAGQYPLGTASFRYWVAVEALRRGADFWSPGIPGGTWQVGSVLPILLDEGADLNAYYDRRALNFFHGPLGDGLVYSGESPDVVCHEMGHAILDTVKPGLWDAAAQEIPAFHESFGDMSSILSGLQVQSLRISVLQETSGHLYRSSRLSRLAEQLATAIRAQAPDAVEADCLRNAVNSFTYQDPLTLPSSAPATQLSSEPHSFSRVFTGAFLEGLAGMLSATAQNSDAPTEQELQAVSREMGAILLAGIRQAPIVANFYSQVATAMVQAASETNSAYAPVLNAAFVRRGILSLQSAAAIGGLASTLGPQKRLAAAAAAVANEPPLARVALDGNRFGLGNRAILVHTASHPRRVSVYAAATDGSQLSAPSADAAATAFVDDLIRRGKVDVPQRRAALGALAPTRSLKTHRLVPADEGMLLQRILFDCGHRHR